MTGPLQLLERGQTLPGPDWLAAARQANADFARRSGLPDRRVENWKYTSVRSLQRRTWELPSDDGEALAPEDLPDLTLPNPGAARVVLVNGRFAPKLSHLPAAGGISVQSLASLDGPELDQYRASLAQSFDTPDATFAALNSALASDGVVIRVAADSQIAEPLEILVLDVARTNGRSSAVRNLVLLEANARLALIERHLSFGEADNLANHLTQVSLAAGSELRHYRLQQLAPGSALVTRTDVEQAAASGYWYFGMDLGGELVRHDLNVRLAERGARCDLSGIYRLNGKCHVDNHSRIDHLAPDAISSEWFKGVLDGQSRAVFNGKVVVHEGADGTDAKQSNANLLLSADCEVDTKPELEIYADDVKCAHGATVGQLDEGQLFYLRSRGIGEAAGRKLLTRAFCMEVLTRVSDLKLRQTLESMLDPELQDH